MRVLAVTNMYPTVERPTYGGFVHSQVESIRAAGVDTDVLFIDGATSKASYARGVLEVRARIREQPYDLVHAHYGLSGLVARAQKDLPLVVSFCGNDILGTPSALRGIRTPFSLAVVAACQVLSELCDAIIVKSVHMRDRLWSPRSRRRAHVVPNGVDLLWARPMSREQAFGRIGGGLDPKKRYVIFPNPPHLPGKRFDLAKAAIERLSAVRSDVELLVVHGKDHDLMPAYYAVADALLLTSDSEGSPNVVKEALACEVPVVSVDVGDVRERIGGAPSCAVADREPEKLSRALERALMSPRPGGLRKRVETLSADHIAEQIIDIYREALGPQTS